MTRINVVPVSRLADKHLVAEYRELPRMFAKIKQWDGFARDAPLRYCLGTGHMKFFQDKGGFLLRRQKELIAEMRRRGFKPQFDNPDDLCKGIPPELMMDWRPTPEARRINEARLRERGGLTS